MERYFYYFFFMESVVYLFAFFTWYAGPMKAPTTTMDMEIVPQESMAQCEANGAALKGVFSEVRWKCIRGVMTSSK